MKSHKISLNGYEVVVSEANALTGLRRNLMRAQAFEIEEDDEARRILRRLYYPDFVSATTEHTGFADWPP